MERESSIRKGSKSWKLRKKERLALESEEEGKVRGGVRKEMLEVNKEK